MTNGSSMEGNMLARIAAISTAAMLTLGSAQAQDYPVRTITLVVPYAAGGPVDTVGRIFAQYLGEALKQQVVVENVAGAGGMVGSQRVAQSAPDGYRILHAGSAVLAQNQLIYKKPLVDGQKDFEMIAIFSDQARVLAVRKDFPAQNLKEFNAYAKANAAKMQYGSAGVGSGSHICPLMMDSINGVKLTHVPYRGSGPAMQDLVAGRLDFIAEQIATIVSLVEAGSIRALAVLGEERVPALPNVPTSKEEGFPELDCGSWGAIVAPKGTPEPILRKLAEATSQALDSPGLKERFNQIGVGIPNKERRSIEFLRAYLPKDIERWTKVVRAANIQLD
jgi:tripartite-type tricarboxylate transporter receptor subunit TctC